MKVTEVDRFWAKVVKTDGCWSWTGYTFPNGRGWFAHDDGRHEGASRVAYALTFGPISNGLFVLHNCSNGLCVRPDHLRLGTHKENMHDRWLAGRYGQKPRTPKRMDCGSTAGKELLAADIEAQRFWQRVQKTDGCWLWLGGANRGLYGAFTTRDGNVAAHRAAYALAHGHLPAGKVVMHLCDVPLCVRPEHLRLGSQADNVHDRNVKGRNNWPLGERNAAARLDWPKVQEIRQRHVGGEGQQRLAVAFGVAQTTIGRVVRGETWKVT